MTRLAQRSVLLVSLILLPLLASSNCIIPLVGQVEAAGCSVSSGDEAEWGQHLRNVSVQTTTVFGGYDEFERSGPGGRSAQDDTMFEDDPMFEDEPMIGYIPLDPLVSGFHTSFSVENGSGAGVRMNLTTGMRYTFCLSISNNASEPLEPPIDAYLMLTHDYEMYTQQYYVYGDELEWMSELEEMIPPEWRGGLWRGYRDVHAYENIREAEFSVVLDKLETSSSMFTGESHYEEFVFIVDAINNSRTDDAPEPHATSLVDMTVMVEEAFILPTWTVPLTCMALMLLLAAVPVVMHFKHTNAGMEGYKVQLVPSLAQESEEE